MFKLVYFTVVFWNVVVLTKIRIPMRSPTLLDRFIVYNKRVTMITYATEQKIKVSNIVYKLQFNIKLKKVTVFRDRCRDDRIFGNTWRDVLVRSTRIYAGDFRFSTRAERFSKINFFLTVSHKMTLERRGLVMFSVLSSSFASKYSDMKLTFCIFCDSQRRREYSSHFF